MYLSALQAVFWHVHFVEHTGRQHINVLKLCMKLQSLRCLRRETGAEHASQQMCCFPMTTKLHISIHLLGEHLLFWCVFLHIWKLAWRFLLLIASTLSKTELAIKIKKLNISAVPTVVFAFLMECSTLNNLFIPSRYSMLGAVNKINIQLIYLTLVEYFTKNTPLDKK